MRNRGFSLIELVIVLVLFSLSVALVAPSLSRFAKRVELKTAAQKVSGILRFSRSESIQKGRVHQIFFDLEAGEVRVQAVEGEEDREKAGEKEEPREKEKRYALPVGVQMKEIDIPSGEFPSDLPTIEFYPNGGSNGGSLILNTQDQKGYKIKVNFLTGLVEVEEA